MIKADQDSLRDHNLSLILTTLLREGQPLSRADLAKRTRLTKASVSLLTSLLLDAGILQERTITDTAEVGRPSRPLAIAPRRLFGTGLQINTDGFGYDLISLDGRVLSTAWIGRDMTHSDPDEIFSSLEQLVVPAIDQLEKEGLWMTGCTLGLPGLVENGRHLLSASNIGWGSLDVQTIPLMKKLKSTCDNEANLAAIAQIPGFATPALGDEIIGPSESFLYLSTDIGIGGAVVEHGRLSRGDHGFSGEFGHVSVNMNGPVCACGRRGCLEMYAGRRALVQAAGITGKAASGQSINAHRLVAAWKAGDKKARAALDQGLRAMDSALVSLINVTDIPTVILGGFWTNFDDGFAEHIQQRVQHEVLAGNRQHVRVRLADNGGHPALTGAAFVSLRSFVTHPAEMLSQLSSR